MKNIPIDEITRTNTLNQDPVGFIFLWKGKVFRAISNDYEFFVKELFNSGLIEDLCNHNLIPKTKISSYTMKGSSLILEHEKLEFQTYPYEWSFSMYKDAALTLLQVNRIAEKYGYQTKDGHLFNILFDFSKPKFVDFGSFTKKKQGTNWVAYEEFLKYVFYPLVLWKNKYTFLSDRLRASSNQVISHSEYLRIMYPLFRLIPSDIFSTLVENFYSYRRIDAIDIKNIELLHKKKQRLILFLRRNKLTFFNRFNFLTWMKKISNLELSSSSFWSNYHDELKTVPFSDLPHRFKFIAGLVKKYKIKSVTDFGGNQGAFSKILLEYANVDNVICLDYDSNAIDTCYIDIKKNNDKIIPVVVNPISPITNRDEMQPKERLKSEAVVALAITHHLLLTQGYTLDLVLDRIANYCNKYIFVEFMPLGLYSGPESPDTPEWYTEKWFKDEFSKKFSFVGKWELAQNRILYFGKIKNQNQE